MALTDSPLIRCMFKRGSDPLPCFYIHNYLFTFRHSGANADIVQYMVSHGDFKMEFCIFGIDTTPNCNTESNLDFVLFIWKNRDRYDFMKYSTTLVRRVYLSLPELLCLKYYRAESGGWRTDIHCSTSIAKYHSTFGHLLPSQCLRTSSCKCMLCTRQPPSLFGSASHIIFHLIRDLGRFTLDIETTHDQYIFAVRSKKTPVQQLLRPDFPTVELLFKRMVLSYKLHIHCSDDERAWKALMEFTFESENQVIYSLVSDKQYWCRHYKRGLFFYRECYHPPSI
jgi:hypothetical protein